MNSVRHKHSFQRFEGIMNTAIKFKITPKLIATIDYHCKDGNPDAMMLKKALDGKEVTEDELFAAERFLRIWMIDKLVDKTTGETGHTKKPDLVVLDHDWKNY